MKTSSLPLLGDAVFLSDGGMETTFIFHEGIELPEFAAFVLLKEATGRAALRRYYQAYIELARRYRLGFVLESATWRASADWGQKLGFDASDLAAINREAIALLHELREESENPTLPMVISGALGPRGDGYLATARMSAAQAAHYHTPQIRSLRDAGADVVTAFTLNYLEEGLGITEAAAALDMPCVISFTVETDGHLPSGQTLHEAIEVIDKHSTRPPAYYMVNCAHPEHLITAADVRADWAKRVHGLRANASRRSHEELNESPELDEGNPGTIGKECLELADKLGGIQVIGGCCGTDLRHVDSMARAWAQHHHITR